MTADDKDLFPELQDQFIQQTVFDTAQCAAASSAGQDSDGGQSHSGGATHIQVKLKRRHLKDPPKGSTIPLSELPLSLGSGPLWQLYRRNNGLEMAPKRPKEVQLDQLLRLIDEIHRCKAIMEDDRDGTQTPTIMEHFFFEHMQSTYGEERVVRHGDHSPQLLIEVALCAADSHCVRRCSRARCVQGRGEVSERSADR